MAEGLQVWDASAGLIFDTNTLTGRIIGTRVVSPTYSEAISVPVSSGKSLWWHFYVQGDATVRCYRQVGQSSNQFTIECTIGYGGTTTGIGYIFYGER